MGGAEERARAFHRQTALITAGSSARDRLRDPGAPLGVRGILLLAVGLAALAGGASAQSLRDIQARNAAAHALEDVRRDLLATQIETSNAQERARTESLLRGLEAQRSGASPEGLVVPPARPTGEAARGEAALSNAMSRIDQLTQDALAESNARMRAIRPASEPKR